MMQPIRMRTAIEMRLFTSGKASSSSPVLVLKVPIFLISNPLCSKSDQHIKFCLVIFSCFVKLRRELRTILGDPGADSGDEGKSKRAEKCGAKKSKERREEPLGTMSYQTSSKRSPPFWLLNGARKLQVFWHQSEARTVATVWNWSGKTLSPGALLAVLYFSSRQIFRPFRLSLVPTICPWVSEDDYGHDCTR